MLKILKITLFNIIFTITLLIIADCIAIYLLYPTNEFKQLRTYTYKRFLKGYNFPSLKNDYIKTYKFRRPFNTNSGKKPIVIFGCSFAYGHKLERNETFSSELARLTDRPIYNRGFNSTGPQFMLYQLKNNTFYKEVPKPEHIIYVYIEDQLPRLYFGLTPYRSRYIFYKTNKSKTGLTRNYLREILLRSYSLYYILQKSKRELIINNPSSENLQLLKLHFIEAKKEAEKNWGKDVKFTILLFENKRYTDNIKSIIPELKSYGIDFIDINELSDKNFTSKEYWLTKNDSHPNAKTWKELTPLIVKKMNL